MEGSDLRLECRILSSVRRAVLELHLEGGDVLALHPELGAQGHNQRLDEGVESMKKKARNIPEFKTIEEEAEFWDTHSVTDYWDEFEDVEVVVELDQPQEERLVLRLHKGVKEQLERVAKSKGLNVSALARMWLLEKLRASHPRHGI